MEKDLIKFEENITVINKDISKYEDEKGTMFVCNTVSLIAKVEALELSKEEYTVKKFDGSIDDLDYEIVDITRPVSKYTLTKKEEDKYVITDSKVAVRKVYNVSNGIGIHKSFTNKEEALALANKINERYIGLFK